MDRVWQDIRYALRMLARNPGFTMVAIVTLALGIGANTAMFSVVNAVLLRPLPYRSSARLASLYETSSEHLAPHSHAAPHGAAREISISYLDFLDWQKQNQLFESIAAFRRTSFNLTGVADPERFPGRRVSANFFSTLGVKPFLGRDFLPADDRLGASPVVVLSHSVWQRRFGSDTSLIGKTLELNGKPVTVIGVLPADFRFYLQAELYAPIGQEADELADRGGHPGIYAVARLKPGVKFEQAAAEMTTIATRLEREYPKTNTGIGVQIKPLRNDLIEDRGAAVLVLLGAVGFVFLICCANVANLLLARGASRAREVAIRKALGANRFELVRQLLTESVLLGIAGGALGLLLGFWGIGALTVLVPPGIERLERIRIDASVFAFTLCISVLAGIIFGLAPALQSSSLDLNSALKEGARGLGLGRERRPLRSALVVSEVALAFVLVFGAGLMIRSFARLLAVNPGIDTKNVLTLQLMLPDSKYPTPATVQAFYDHLRERVRTLPGVETAALVTPLPLSGEGWQDGFYLEGRPMPEDGRFPASDFHTVSPGYWKAMGIALLKGREFTEQDDEHEPGAALDQRIHGARLLARRGSHR